MSDFDPILTIVFLIISFSICSEVWKKYFVSCEKCGGRFILDSHKNPKGDDISKKVNFFLVNIPRRNIETWKCESCDHQEIKKYWSSR